MVLVVTPSLVQEVCRLLVRTSTKARPQVNQGSLIVGGSLSDFTNVTVAADGLYGVAADDQVGSIAGAGQIQLGAQTLTAGNTSNTEFSGVISGQTGGLTKVGSGELVLSGENTYGGTTLVQDGTLTVTGSAPTEATCATGASSNICVQPTAEPAPVAAEEPAIFELEPEPDPEPEPEPTF